MTWEHPYYNTKKGPQIHCIVDIEVLLFEEIRFKVGAKKSQIDFWDSPILHNSIEHAHVYIHLDKPITYCFDCTNSADLIPA